MQADCRLSVAAAWTDIISPPALSVWHFEPLLQDAVRQAQVIFCIPKKEGLY